MDKIPLSRNRDALNHTIYNCENEDASQDRVEKYTGVGKFSCGFSVFQSFSALSPDLLYVLCTQDTTAKLMYGNLYCAKPFFCVVSHIRPKLFSPCVPIAA